MGGKNLLIPPKLCHECIQVEVEEDIEIEEKSRVNLNIEKETTSRDLNSKRTFPSSNTLVGRITFTRELPEEEPVMSQIYSSTSKVQADRPQTIRSQLMSVGTLLTSCEEEYIVVGEIPSVTFQFTP